MLQLLHGDTVQKLGPSLQWGVQQKPPQERQLPRGDAGLLPGLDGFGDGEGCHLVHRNPRPAGQLLHEDVAPHRVGAALDDLQGLGQKSSTGGQGVTGLLQEELSRT
ncbi:hypothetical protein HRbin09_01522 [bacterium HR09]|nr:hypothetical protein HRbin09_01522 [bacterium HR09]